jgi:hypothetical protein
MDLLPCSSSDPLGEKNAQRLLEAERKYNEGLKCIRVRAFVSVAGQQRAAAAWRPLFNPVSFWPGQ